MSASGTKRTSPTALHMSAFGGKADMLVACFFCREAIGDSALPTEGALRDFPDCSFKMSARWALESA